MDRSLPADATLLGEEQWAWLEEELRQPADVRIICSSISFGSQYNQNGDEVWAIFPREQARMLALLHTTRARGVLFVSGDLHYAELNELGVEHGAPYTLHDLTSSGLTMTWPTTAPNRFRVAGPVSVPNWGAVEIDFAADDPTVELRVHDAASGAPLVGRSLRLSDLQPRGGWR